MIFSLLKKKSRKTFGGFFKAAKGNEAPSDPSSQLEQAAASEIQSYLLSSNTRNTRVNIQDM